MAKCVLVGDIVDMLSEYLCADWVVRPIVGLRFVEVRRNNGKSLTRFNILPNLMSFLMNTINLNNLNNDILCR